MKGKNMLLHKLVSQLDKEFFNTPEKENLANWSYTQKSKKYINQDFLDLKTGLMIKGSENVSEVFTCVFITDEIVEKLTSLKNCMIITHHNFDFFEDGRGLCPIKAEVFEKLIACNISIYVAHAGLDTHEIYGTSKTLAEILGVQIENYFFDYFGKPTALIGNVKNDNFDQFIEETRNTIKREKLTVEKYHNKISKIAVIAGGGDEAEILRAAYELGADTLIGGTIENTWKAPFVQEANKEFHKLNKELKLNLIGGSHYATERPAMIKLVQYIDSLGVKCSYMEDEKLLNTY
ncbi:MAG: Nif3-like dinuclear metal center hexameric protein [Clostridiales bacterium]|nr:Nif3-like dinuclear metal center hexameric protein [Clostridiales bacterium]